MSKTKILVTCAAALAFVAATLFFEDNAIPQNETPVKVITQAPEEENLYKFPKEQGLGFIYKHDIRGYRTKTELKEFTLFDLAKQQWVVIDTALPLAWRGFGEKPVILYSIKESLKNKNILSVMGYDLKSPSVQEIVVGSDFDSGSSTAFSPILKKVAYCTDDEQVFAVKDLVSGAERAYPEFSGCRPKISFAGPRFSPDGSAIYYQDFPVTQEDGIQSWDDYNFRVLALGTGVSSDAPYETNPTNERFNTKYQLYATIESRGSDVDSYNNDFVILDLSNIPRASVGALIKEGKAPRFFSSDSMGTYVHIGDIINTDDMSGFFFYTYVKKDGIDNDYKIGFFDIKTKKLRYPVSNIPDEYDMIQLLKARDANLLVFAGVNRKTDLSDLFYVGVGLKDPVLVDRNIGLLGSKEVYFVESI